MRSAFALLTAALLSLTDCSKSSQPPQKPVTPRGGSVEAPVQPPAP